MGLTHLLYYCLPCLLYHILLSHRWILSSSQKYPIHHAGLHYLLYFYPLFLLSVLVNPWLTSPGSWAQELLITVYLIHDYIECVTGIFSLFTGDEIIRDSCILEILPSSTHDLLEFSLSDAFQVPRKIRFRGVLSHDVIWILFTLDILDINILLPHHVPQKMTTDINVLCTDT